MDARATTIRRRVVSIGRTAALFVAITATLPITIPVVGTIDLVRRIGGGPSFVGLRLLAFGWVYLGSSMAAIARLGIEWVVAGFGRRTDVLVRLTRRSQMWWSQLLFDSVVRLFGLQVSVAGEDLVQSGPYVAFFPHASLIDSLLPAALITNRYEVWLRYVLKAELLSDPALDIAAHRMVNRFVDRSSADPAAEIKGVKALADGLAHNEGVLIYPEGTRFTPERQRRALTRLVRKNPELADRAAAFRHVLPPRLGGPLALLDSGLDIVVCAHHGLAGFATPGDVWAGGIVGRTISVQFWRYGADEIPQGRQERVDWLFDIWKQVDDWIATKSRG